MAYIFAAKRSAIATLGGELANIPIANVATEVIKNLLQTSKIAPAQIDEVILGNVLPAAQGMNLARQVAIQAGIPNHATAYTINQVCASGLRSVALGAQAIDSGMMNCVIAGGLESMSAAPHALNIRAGKKFGDAKMIDTMQHDGLHCALENYGMGMTAENIAGKYQISREAQDKFAYNSQVKADKAIKAGAFEAEIVPIKYQNKKQEMIFDTDAHPRLTTLDKLASLRPAFVADGTVTAGNSSGMNDGTASLILGNAQMTQMHKPMARIIDYAVAGVSPDIMGMGPVPAIEKLLAQTNMNLADIDLFEINEAFAVQSLAVLRELNIAEEKVNIRGGAIALGHPLGASGARVLTSLLHALGASGLTRGIASLCVGGGMGIALMVEMV